MKIFKEEKTIASLIKKNQSIAYTADIDKADLELFAEHSRLWQNYTDMDTDIHNVVAASIKDKELFYHTSILVTTNWNKNGDVFMPEEVWAARYTPIHKPTNLEHTSKIIGHMIGSWAINTDGSKIDNEIQVSELPSKFHILVGSVIYKFLPDNEEYGIQIAALLDSIEKGEKYVSMECRFDDFDYALAKEENIRI